MSRVVIVARTRMRGEHVCIGGHDLDERFRGLRLLDRFGDHWTTDSAFEVGEVWNLRYLKRTSRPPHVEDVCVMEQHRLDLQLDLKTLVLRRVKPWEGGTDVLFDRTVHATVSGSGYIPANGRLPRGSTGYWIPASDLLRQAHGTRAQFVVEGESAITRLAWVGVQAPPPRIEAGSLLRVSLSRLFGGDSTPEGYYVQISGVIGS